MFSSFRDKLSGRFRNTKYSDVQHICFKVVFLAQHIAIAVDTICIPQPSPTSVEDGNVASPGQTLAVLRIKVDISDYIVCLHLLTFSMHRRERLQL